MRLEEFNSRGLIVKSNKLIEASYRLTVQEKRLIYLLITKINKDDDDFKEYSFTVQELKKFLDVKGQSYYTELKNITRDLISKVLTIKEEKSILQVAWLSSAEYLENQGIVRLGLSPKMKPYLLQLKAGFTKFLVKNIINLTSIYSVRIYELLKQYENLGNRIIKLDELRRILKTEKSYDLYSNFKLKILLVSQKEINEKSDISFDFEEIKEARKVVAINFIIYSRPQTPEQLHISNSEENIEQAIDQTAVAEQICVDIDKQTGNPVLISLKIYFPDGAIARSYIEKFGDDYCAKKIDLLRYTQTIKEIAYPSRWLASAIEKDYKDPREISQKEKERKIKEAESLKKKVLAQDAVNKSKEDKNGGQDITKILPNIAAAAKKTGN